MHCLSCGEPIKYRNNWTCYWCDDGAPVEEDELVERHKAVVESRIDDRFFSVAFTDNQHFASLRLDSMHGEIPANMFQGKQGIVERIEGAWRFVPDSRPTPPEVL